MYSPSAQHFLDRLPEDWQALLLPLVTNPEWIALLKKLDKKEYSERLSGDHLAPPADRVFRALVCTPVNDVKVVLLGQDPYHTPGLAQGLAFSIPESIKPGSKAFPSSLRNISKALALDGYPSLENGNLERWANQGVLLLNATLTVTLGQANAHADWGWQLFTDQLIKSLSAHKPEIAWLLWGSFAQKKQDLIAPNKGHLILTASHPSGLSVYKTDQPFIYPKDKKSCGHFRQVNDWRMKLQKQPILW